MSSRDLAASVGDTLQFAAGMSVRAPSHQQNSDGASSATEELGQPQDAAACRRDDDHATTLVRIAKELLALSRRVRVLTLLVNNLASWFRRKRPT